MLQPQSTRHILTALYHRLLKPASRHEMSSKAYIEAIRPRDHAVFNLEKMGKSTIFSSQRILVGLNCFEPGQEHQLHSHEGMDKIYHVIEGKGLFLLEGREIKMKEGLMLIAPEGVAHGVRNTSEERLVVLAVLAPGP